MKNRAKGIIIKIYNIKVLIPVYLTASSANKSIAKLYIKTHVLKQKMKPGQETYLERSIYRFQDLLTK